MAGHRVLAVLLLFAAAVTCYKEDVMAKLKKCKNGAEVTEHDLEEFMKPLLPESEDEKCLVACVLREYNIIEDGHYNPVMAIAVGEELFKDEPKMAEKVRDMVNECKSDVPPKLENDCDLGEAIIKCVVAYEKKVGAA